MAIRMRRKTQSPKSGNLFPAQKGLGAGTFCPEKKEGRDHQSVGLVGFEVQETFRDNVLNLCYLSIYLNIRSSIITHKLLLLLKL